MSGRDRYRIRARAAPPLALLALCFALAASSSLAAQAGGQSGATPEPLIVRAAQQIGIKRCMPVVVATARRVISGTDRQDIVVDWDHQGPDAGPLFSLTGTQHGAERTIVSMAAMPAADGRCSLLVERMAVASTSCAAVAGDTLAGMAGTALVPGITVYASPDQPNQTYTLMELSVGAAQRCLVVRRMTTFNWPQRR